MSDSDIVKISTQGATDTTDSKEPIICDENIFNDSVDIEQIIEDMETFKYCKTNILKEVEFKSKVDKFVFDSLPLSNSQKEELLLSLYKTPGNLEVNIEY